MIKLTITYYNVKSFKVARFILVICSKKRPMRFLYPNSKTLIFNDICNTIIKELQKRNWSVPNINIHFCKYGSGRQKFKYVSSIDGCGLKINFGRIQRKISGGVYNDIAGVIGISINQRTLQIQDKDLIIYLYTENNGSRSCYYQELIKDPRTGIEIFVGDFFYFIERTIFTSQYTKKLDVEKNIDKDTKRLEAKQVFNDFKKHFENMLDIIRSYPILKNRTETLDSKEVIPIPKEFDSIFCFCDNYDAICISKGKIDPKQLHPSECYGLTSAGPPLMYSIKEKGYNVPIIAYESFLWCGLGKVTKDMQISRLNIPGYHRIVSSENHVVLIRPNRADDIYIADQDEYEKYQIKIHEKNQSEYYSRGLIARARTITPIYKYKGGFVKPVVLIKRELSFDEVEIII